MKNLISRAITGIASCFKGLQVQRFFAVVLIGFVVLATNVSPAQDNQSLGERMRNRVEQFDRNTERPKTTGQFLDEADRDIPLGERMKNITRDSKEAFQQFGKEYSVGAQESARNVGDKAADVVK